ncbi:hypothetical protein Zmor_024395 [Zophobas morio]|uniref:Uncharacterized protein n=1 Tax=Zophobas morio TaxID=2755281 RepID=A0AA38HYS0_9CUCU|nr:hypothetical protein Zmor_024395 [Zophobas morio]
MYSENVARLVRPPAPPWPIPKIWYNEVAKILHIQLALRWVINNWSERFCRFLRVKMFGFLSGRHFGRLAALCKHGESYVMEGMPFSDER